MKLFHGAIVNVLLLSAVAAVGVGWSIEHRRLLAANAALRDLQAQIAAGAPSNQTLERKRVPLAGAAKGSIHAPITIVEFSDFQCPYSGRVTVTIDQIFAEYLGQIRIYFRHAPLPFHVDAPLAAEAALAAEAEGKLWEMHDKLFASQRNLTREDLEEYASELGLDMTRFRRALDTRAYKSRVEQDLAAAEQFGAKGTPVFFINGRMLTGAQPIGAF